MWIMGVRPMGYMTNLILFDLTVFQYDDFFMLGTGRMLGETINSCCSKSQGCSSRIILHQPWLRLKRGEPEKNFIFHAKPTC